MFVCIFVYRLPVFGKHPNMDLEGGQSFMTAFHTYANDIRKTISFIHQCHDIRKLKTWEDWVGCVMRSESRLFPGELSLFSRWLIISGSLKVNNPNFALKNDFALMIANFIRRSKIKDISWPSHLFSSRLFHNNLSKAGQNFLASCGVGVPYSTGLRMRNIQLQVRKEKLFRNLGGTFIWFDNFSKFYRHSTLLKGSYSNFSWTAFGSIKLKNPMSFNISTPKIPILTMPEPLKLNKLMHDIIDRIDSEFGDTYADCVSNFPNTTSVGEMNYFSPIVLEDVNPGSIAGLKTNILTLNTWFGKNTTQYMITVADINIFWRLIKQIIKGPDFGSDLKNQWATTCLVPILGFWHPYKLLVEKLWSTYLSTVFAPLFHFLWPTKTIVRKPKLSQMEFMLNICFECYDELKLDLEILKLAIQFRSPDEYVNFNHACNLVDFFEKFLPCLIEIKRNMRKNDFGTRSLNYSMMLILFLSFPSSQYIYGMMVQLWNFDSWRRNKPDLFNIINSNSASLVEDVGEISLSMLARKTAILHFAKCSIDQMTDYYLLSSTQSKFPVRTQIKSSHKCKGYLIVKEKTLKLFKGMADQLILNSPYLYFEELIPRQFKYTKPVPFTNKNQKPIIWLEPETFKVKSDLWSSKLMKLLGFRNPKKSVKSGKSAKSAKSSKSVKTGNKKAIETSESDFDEEISDDGDDDSDVEEIYAILEHKSVYDAAGNKTRMYLVEWLDSESGKNSRDWLDEADLLHCEEILREYLDDPKDVTDLN